MRAATHDTVAPGLHFGDPGVHCPHGVSVSYDDMSRASLSVSPAGGLSKGQWRMEPYPDSGPNDRASGIGLLETLFLMAHPGAIMRIFRRREATYRGAMTEADVVCATAKDFALSMDSVYVHGATSPRGHICSLSSLRGALEDMKIHAPECTQAIEMLVREFAGEPVDLAGSQCTLRDPSRNEKLILTNLHRVAYDGIHGGAIPLSVGKQMVDMAVASLPESTSSGRAEGCALIIGLAIEKVLHNTQSAETVEKIRRRSCAAEIASRWLYWRVCR